MQFLREKPSFKLRLNKQIILPGILFASMGIISLLLHPLLGINSLILANCIGFIVISKTNDYTINPKYHFILFSVICVGMALAGWLANINLIMKAVVMFFVIVGMIYALNKGKRKPLYIVLTITFIFCVYYPVYGKDLLIRIIIFESSVVVMMLFQYFYNRKAFRKSIRDQMLSIIKDIDEYAILSYDGISSVENEMYHKRVEEKMTNLSTALFDKFVQINKWERGNEYLRVLSILKTITDMVYRSTKKGKGLEKNTYERLNKIISLIEVYNFDEDDFDKLIHSLGELRLNSIDSPDEYFINNGLNVFVKENKKDKNPVIEAHKRHRFNKDRFIYATKTALLSSVGVYILGLFKLPYEYWFPINVCILSQPFYEFNRTKSRSRLFNTALGGGIAFIAFHVTDIMWVRILVLIALVFVCDMFFKMEFITIYIVFVSLLLGYSHGHGSIGELSVLRFVYVLAASIIVFVLDSIVSPRNLKNTFIKRLSEAKDINIKIEKYLSSDNFKVDEFKKLFDEKLEINNHILNLRPYYNTEEMDAYYFKEQAIHRIYTVLLYQMLDDRENATRLQKLFAYYLLTGQIEDIAKNDSDDIFTIYEMYDLHDAILNSNKKIEEITYKLSNPL